MNELTAVSIGGYGHIDSVFDDIAQMRQIRLIGLAPGYDGEDISGITNLEPAAGKKVYPNYSQMLDELKPNIAIIGTRLDWIGKIIIDAARAGCHIIAEKPLSLDIGTLENVRREVQNNNVNLMAMLTMRSKPHFIAAKEVYSSGDIGEAVLINTRKSYKWGSRPEWFGDKSKYGGTIGWVGIHALDAINFITGLEFTKVAAMQSNFAHAERPGCQDNCAVILELSNGGHATVSIDYFRPENAPTHGDDWIRIVGTNGVIQASGVKNECSVISSDKGAYQHPVASAKDRIYKKFITNIIEGVDNSAIRDVSFMLTKICLLADEASEKKMTLGVE